jgi:hypothetical protein
MAMSSNLRKNNNISKTAELDYPEVHYTDV